MPNFLDLPPELRNQIYSYLLSPFSNRRHLGDSFYAYDYSPSLVLYRLNRQIYLESRKIFHSLNTFVRISTHWEQAKHHVALEGQVSILLSSPEANKFPLDTLSVTIDTFYPNSEFETVAYYHFIILFETGDLARFCRSWYYSSLNMPYLNSHLSLDLALHDPYTSTSPFPMTGEPHIPKLKQSQLLEPFKQVKQLRGFQVSGNVTAYPSLVKSLNTEMKKSLDPPEKCLERATELKDLGNAALTSGKYKEAIEYYNKAFFAVHVIIDGKNRRVYGDAWFDATITEEGPFKGQHAGTARIIIRVRLVANTILAYLKLNNYDMAIHTGMRTIKIMRTSIGLDEDEGATDPNLEAMVGFVASGEMGKIYYRTGMAYKAIDEKSDARKLLKVAAVYLPNDKTVKQDLASVALRLS
ncbi:hypothetical protein H072_313 [Dactylellina haptotyla CBS 200.50]|uniref:Uncharacterized protein n=1 Tax=Dactylellina haptotyla (strain CBS 200.50) TaxID=1284197 RepID=S8ARU4_DACHA|nr:hypothetical protein H072_313 [Dactylellina haptotyla CBS 200.50]